MKIKLNATNRFSTTFFYLSCYFSETDLDGNAPELSLNESSNSRVIHGSWMGLFVLRQRINISHEISLCTATLSASYIYLKIHIHDFTLGYFLSTTPTQGHFRPIKMEQFSTLFYNFVGEMKIISTQKKHPQEKYPKNVK